jgi:hypothetical protein
MRTDKHIAIPKNIQDICDIRETVRQKVEMVHKLSGESSKILSEITAYAWPYEATPRLSVARTMAEIDRRLWQHAFDKTGLNQFMDAKARREFNNGLDKNPPPFTMETARSTLMDTATAAPGMFKRSVVEFFQGLSGQYRTNTNEPFKVGKRVVCTYMTSHWHGYIEVNYGTYSNGSAQLNDLDRVFKVLDEKQHHPRELENLVNMAWKQGEVYEDDYFQIKGFKNGNAHILFKRADLLQKANKIIHEYFDGSALPDGRAAA